MRDWIDEEVADGYGGTVAAKCANIMATNGAVAQVACGSGQPFGWVPVLVAGIPVILATLATVALLTGTGHSAADATPPPTVHGQFEVLSEGAGSSDRASLSDKARQWLSSIGSEQSTQLSAEAAGATTGTLTQAPSSEPTAIATAEGSSGDTVVVAEVAGRLCVLSEGFEVGLCASRSLAEAGQAFSAAPAGCSAYHVVGIMPDGVTALTTSTGTSEIPVRSNVYEATLSPQDTVLSSTDGNVRVEIPLSGYAAGNSACG